MSTKKLDLRHEARLRALQAGHRSLSAVSRSLRISRARLDDILQGRSRCKPDELLAIADCLQWQELPCLLQQDFPQRAESAPPPARSSSPSRRETPASEFTVREHASTAYPRVAFARQPYTVVWYPGDLPPGVPLWAVVVLEQARSLGQRPRPRDPDIPEAWALTALELIEGFRQELEREFRRRRAKS